MSEFDSTNRARRSVHYDPPNLVLLSAQYESKERIASILITDNIADFCLRLRGPTWILS